MPSSRIGSYKEVSRLNLDRVIVKVSFGLFMDLLLLETSQLLNKKAMAGELSRFN